jgi:hypothetical protein
MTKRKYLLKLHEREKENQFIDSFTVKPEIFFQI